MKGWRSVCCFLDGGWPRAGLLSRERFGETVCFGLITEMTEADTSAVAGGGRGFTSCGVSETGACDRDRLDRELGGGLERGLEDGWRLGRELVLKFTAAMALSMYVCMYVHVGIVVGQGLRDTAYMTTHAAVFEGGGCS